MPVEPEDDEDDVDLTSKKKKTSGYVKELNPREFVAPGADWEKYLVGTGIGREIAAWLIWGQVFFQPLGATVNGLIVAVAGLAFGVACIPIGVAVGSAGLVAGAALKLAAGITRDADINTRADRALSFSYYSFTDCMKHAFVNITLTPFVIAKVIANTLPLTGMYVHPTSGGNVSDMPETVTFRGLDKRFNLPRSMAYVVDQSRLEYPSDGKVYNIVDFQRMEAKLPHGPGSKVAKGVTAKSSKTTEKSAEKKPIELTPPSPVHVRGMKSPTPSEPEATAPSTKAEVGIKRTKGRKS